MLAPMAASGCSTSSIPHWVVPTIYSNSHQQPLPIIGRHGEMMEKCCSLEPFASGAWSKKVCNRCKCAVMGWGMPAFFAHFTSCATLSNTSKPVPLLWHPLAICIARPVSFITASSLIHLGNVQYMRRCKGGLNGSCGNLVLLPPWKVLAQRVYHRVVAECGHQPVRPCTLASHLGVTLKLSEC